MLQTKAAMSYKLFANVGVFITGVRMKWFRGFGLFVGPQHVVASVMA
jgi:hypothetical protein